jgi:hypothetical protein
MGHSMYRSETDGLDEETGFCGGRFELAERVGFEPTLEFPLNTLSKRAPSATRPSLRRESDGRNDSYASCSAADPGDPAAFVLFNSMGEVVETAT